MTTEQKHSPTRIYFLRVAPDAPEVIIDAAGNTVACACGPQDESEPDNEMAARIVACVNACAGIDTEWLEREEPFAIRGMKTALHILALTRCLRGVTDSLAAEINPDSPEIIEARALLAKVRP